MTGEIAGLERRQDRSKSRLCVTALRVVLCLLSRAVWLSFPVDFATAWPAASVVKVRGARGLSPPAPI